MEMNQEENIGIQGRVVAVTGGLGLVGSNVCLELLRRGALQVRSLDCRKTSPWSDHLTESGVHCINGDVVSIEDVEEALDGVDCVIHLASYGGSGKEMVQTRRIEEVNVEGTRNVLETCVKKGITKVVYLSSNGVVFGGKEIENGDETLPCLSSNQYVGPYDQTKSVAEQLVLKNNGRIVETRSGHGSLLSTCAIRCPLVYGPAEEKYLDRLISDARLGLLLFKIGDPNSKIDWIYVDNIVLALMLATTGLMSKYSKVAGKAYFVSDGSPINFFEFLQPLLKNLDYDLPKSSLSIPLAVSLGNICKAIYIMLSPLLNQRWIPQPLILPPEVYKVGVTNYYSIQKAKEELGYEPKTHPEEAMTETITYFKDKKRREVDGPSIYAWLFCVIGLPSILSVAWLPDIGPIPFLRVIALFIFRSMLALRIASGIVVTAHVSEAFYALWLARRVDPRNATAWFWRTLLLATFSLRLLWKRRGKKKTKPSLSLSLSRSQILRSATKTYNLSTVMTSLSRELVFLILQFLDEEKYKDTVHRLELESGYYFNMRYFEELVNNGEWDEVEKYLSGFSKLEDNRYSMKIFFEIRKQKYLEALDKRDRAKAVDILVKDLKVFAGFNEDLFKEITLLLTLDDFRANEQLSKYGDTKSARGVMFGELKKLIEANPLFRDKLQFPVLKSSRLRTLINQSLNWQHQLCKNPRPNPDIRSLFLDHTCNQPNGARAASPSPGTNHLMGGGGGGGVPKIAGFHPLMGGGGGLFQPAPGGPGGLPANLSGWMANQSVVPHPSAAPSGPMGLGSPNNAGAILKRPQTPSGPTPMEYQTADSNHVSKRSRPYGTSEEGGNIPVNILPVTYAGHPHGHNNTLSPDDLPKVVVTTLAHGSPVMSIDFHPIQQIVLLVGTIGGDVYLWDLGARQRITEKGFDVWKLDACSKELQASLNADASASVNHVAWSPDGTLFGVAYSKSLVHIYSFQGSDIRNHLEIEAHTGSVSHLAFSYPNKQLSVVTCGDDRIIKVWDAVTGEKRYTFEGHEAPVFSVCPHYKENIQFVFSTAADGKIKAWLYDNVGSRVDYDAPGHSSTRMAYSSDGTRLFSCGTNKEGESFLVEWNESEGSIKRTYLGLGQRAAGIVQFDTTRNRFLAAGDESTIKIWDMDNTNPLTTIHADGGLPASPCVRFNREGILLAVSTNDHGVRILATDDGIRLLRTAENRSFAPVMKVPAGGGGFGSSSANAGITMADRANSFAAMENNEVRTLADGKPRIADDLGERSRACKVTEITEPSQCCSMRLADNVPVTKVSRLIYTNSGSGVLALASNAVHKLWKWQKSDHNLAGKATANAQPVLWQPASGIMMTNETSDANPEDAIPCFALSKNDSYVMSASGGKISLFNMMTFKTMTTFMPPPPAATFLAFHPLDNNIIAIGMEDSSIQIYNVRTDEVKTKLNGHQNRITGLAFSQALNILVSSGADSQLCVWSMDGWEKQSNKYLQVQHGRSLPAVSDTRVQFHLDQIHLLVVHETQIAIYDAQKLDWWMQWVRKEATGPITSATYSCDSQSIFVSFENGSVDVLTASNLRLRCRINPTAYLPPNPSSRVYPLVIAAHPSETNQFAVGLNNGAVHVVEPSETEGKWGTSPPLENGAAVPDN